MVASTPAISPEPRKHCPQCARHRPLSAFGKNRQAKDGLHYYCKECAAQRQRAWAAANAATVKRMRADYLKRVYARNEGRDPYTPEALPLERQPCG